MIDRLHDSDPATLGELRSLILALAEKVGRLQDQLDELTNSNQEETDDDGVL